MNNKPKHKDKLKPKDRQKSRENKKTIKTFKTWKPEISPFKTNYKLTDRTDSVEWT